MALVAINFNDGEVNLFMNLKNLKYQFPDYENSDVVVKMNNWNKTDIVDDTLSYYFIGELINQRLEISLKVRNYYYTIYIEFLILNLGSGYLLQG